MDKQVWEWVRTRSANCFSTIMFSHIYTSDMFNVNRFWDITLDVHFFSCYIGCCRLLKQKVEFHTWTDTPFSHHTQSSNLLIGWWQIWWEINGNSPPLSHYMWRAQWCLLMLIEPLLKAVGHLACQISGFVRRLKLQPMREHRLVWVHCEEAKPNGKPTQPNVQWDNVAPYNRLSLTFSLQNYFSCSL